jgi:hypothetical protein
MSLSADDSPARAKVLSGRRKTFAHNTTPNPVLLGYVPEPTEGQIENISIGLALTLQDHN